jgi:hypothetical protein
MRADIDTAEEDDTPEGPNQASPALKRRLEGAGLLDLDIVLQYRGVRKLCSLNSLDTNERTVLLDKARNLFELLGKSTFMSSLKGAVDGLYDLPEPKEGTPVAAHACRGPLAPGPVANEEHARGTTSPGLLWRPGSSSSDGAASEAARTWAAGDTGQSPQPHLAHATTLPAALEDDTQTAKDLAAALGGVRHIIRPEKMNEAIRRLLNSNRDAKSSVREVAVALAALNVPKKELPDKVTKDLLKAAKKAVRNVCLWRAAGTVMGMDSTEALVRAFQAATQGTDCDDNTVSQLKNGHRSVTDNHAAKAASQRAVGRRKDQATQCDSPAGVELDAAQVAGTYNRTSPRVLGTTLDPDAESLFHTEGGTSHLRAWLPTPIGREWRMGGISNLEVVNLETHRDLPMKLAVQRVPDVVCGRTETQVYVATSRAGVTIGVPCEKWTISPSQPLTAPVPSASAGDGGEAGFLNTIIASAVLGRLSQADGAAQLCQVAAWLSEALMYPPGIGCAELVEGSLEGLCRVAREHPHDKVVAKSMVAALAAIAGPEFPSITAHRLLQGEGEKTGVLQAMIAHSWAELLTKGGSGERAGLRRALAEDKLYLEGPAGLVEFTCSLYNQCDASRQKDAALSCCISLGALSWTTLGDIALGKRTADWLFQTMEAHRGYPTVVLQGLIALGELCKAMEATAEHKIPQRAPPMDVEGNTFISHIRDKVSGMVLNCCACNEGNLDPMNQACKLLTHTHSVAEVCRAIANQARSGKHSRWKDRMWSVLDEYNERAGPRSIPESTAEEALMVLAPTVGEQDFGDNYEPRHQEGLEALRTIFQWVKSEGGQPLRDRLRMIGVLFGTKALVPLILATAQMESLLPLCERTDCLATGEA